MTDEDREQNTPEPEAEAPAPADETKGAADETPDPAEETKDAADETPAPADEPQGAPVDEAEPAAQDAAAAEADSAGEADPEAGGAESPSAEVPATEEDAPAGPEASADDDAPKERAKRGRRQAESDDAPEVIPGAHLEPDLVLDETGDRGEMGGRAGAEIEAAEEALAAEAPSGALGEGAGENEQPESPAPVASSVLDLAADARYRATGKRKSAVARVILRPGTGVYTVNGRELDSFFPRPTLQRIARGPLETVGHEDRMDVVAKIHGGGVSSQAGALRHGIARALVEADPNLRGELKRRGFLTRDPRVKERKKAGLKKARKRPQFSKR